MNFLVRKRLDISLRKFPNSSSHPKIHLKRVEFYRYVAVGNEPFLKSYNGTYDKTTFPALKNIQKALIDAKVGDKIKATIPFNADVYESSGSYKPCDGCFRNDIKDTITQIVRYFKENNVKHIPFSQSLSKF